MIGTELHWLETISKDSWQVNLAQVDFGQPNILNGVETRALMNPSFPFIAAPINDFNAFKEVLKGLNIGYDLTCSALDWCYFKTGCENVQDKLPELKFHLGSGKQRAVFSMTGANYIFAENNAKKKIKNCHIAIIGQDFSEVDFWILGDIFNFNFYTSFDAENTPRIGLALQVEAALGATITPTPVAEPN